MPQTDQTCPGCGLAMPPSDTATYEGYYHTSPECWSVYSEVLAAEYSNAVLYGQVHQLSVDAYAVQHAGGSHPDKSVGIHLSGLYLILEKEASPPEVPYLHKRLANSIEEWPRFDPPSMKNEEVPTVLEVALADSMQEHIVRSRKWASQVWKAWTPYHEEIAELVTQHLDQEPIHGRRS